jgi:hypothetical protein
VAGADDYGEGVVMIAPRRESAMEIETYEYLTDVYPERELQSRLDELGLAGWELITAKWEEYSFGGRTHNQARCILKRRVLRAKDIFADPDDLHDPDDEFSSTLKALRRS